MKDLQRPPATLRIASKPSNASVNTTFALRLGLNSMTMGSDAPFIGLNGALNGPVPLRNPNFVFNGEVGG